MAFLAVFALALSMAAGRLAERWQSALAQTATVRIAAPPEKMEAETAKVLAFLKETPGVATATAMSKADQEKLLTPWFGPDLPIGSLPLPQLIDIQETAQGLDPEGLRNRLAAEAPDAVFDDHNAWRKPLVAAAERLRLLGLAAIALIAATMAAVITLAAGAALSANAQVIGVLRLIGARDAYVARAFVRRFTLRAFAGALAGTVIGMAAMAAMPATGSAGTLLTGLGFAGLDWLLPLTIPPLAAIVAFAATRGAALRRLRRLP
ncbi:FtsX-like permease family protein [Thioclava sp. BHET1]|nr:FtsX-like permease family protein [Thioclava sp. BHET1]